MVFDDFSPTNCKSKTRIKRFGQASKQKERSGGESCWTETETPEKRHQLRQYLSKDRMAVIIFLLLIRMLHVSAFVPYPVYRRTDLFVPVPIYRNKAAVKTPTTLPALPLTIPRLSSIPSVTTATLLISHLSLVAERRTKWGASLSAPLITMAIALFLSNFGVIPVDSVVYTFYSSTLIPLCIPLLLFQSDIRAIQRASKSMLVAFFLGAVGTVFGTILASRLVPSVSREIAACLCARHIGGAVNFVAVANYFSSSLDSSVLASAIAADNVIVGSFFILLLFVSRFAQTNDVAGAADVTGVADVTGAADGALTKGEDEGAGDLLSDISLAITVSASVNLIGFMISPKLQIPIASLLTIILATTWRGAKRLSRVSQPLGILFVQLFFTGSGACGSIIDVIKGSTTLFLFSGLQISAHFVFMTLVGNRIGIKLRELLVASNACVGGPTTAAGFATAKQWRDLVVPGLLVGIVGYSTGTFLGIFVHALL